MSGRTFFFVTLSWIVFAGSSGSSRADGILDSIQFGNGISEQGHAAVVEKTATETGGLGETCRRIQPGGAIEFDAVCDPQKQNYLTVKFWGSDTNVATTYLFNNDQPLGNYGEAPPEFDSNDGGATLPGRFYYVTYAIPQDMTTGKGKVHLKLVALGALSPYAANPKDRVHPLKEDSIGFYRAYTSIDPFFVPDAGEKQGAAPALVSRPAGPAAEAMTAMNRQQIDEIVTKMLAWQLYGSQWDARVKAGEVPAVLTGATLRPGRLEGSADQIKDAVTAKYSDGNDAGMNVVAIYAKAYTSAWSQYYQKPEMLDRVVKALDFFCVAQGANGGFNSNKWAGGPTRQKAGHPLEGFGSQGPARAFLEVASDLQAKQLLDQPIDADGTGTPSVPRKTAYARMFAQHRDFLISGPGRGHASNQDLAQMTAAWLCNEAVRKLDPAQALSREAALDYVYQAVGLKNNPMGGYWVTTKGLSLEPWGTLAGGYCGNYGIVGMREICDLAQLTDDDKVKQRAKDTLEATAHFYFPAPTAEGNPAWRVEGIISTRNTKWPCVIDYGWDAYSAAYLKVPTAEREFALWLQDGNTPLPLDPGNAHVLGAAMMRIYNAGWFDEELKNKPDAALPLLPMEKEHSSFAWADEQGQAVALKDGDARLYLSLNWRRGFEKGGRDAAHARVNNIARAHYSDSALDRIATFSMQTVGGVGGLDLCRYGKYYIAMNTSGTKEYPVTLPDGVQAQSVRDLISGNSFDPGKIPPLKAQTTYIFDLEKD